MFLFSHLTILYDLSIKWDEVHKFTKEGSLSEWDPPKNSGVYVIAYREDPTAQSTTYTPIYVGESENFDDRGFSSHHKRECWLKLVNNNEKRLAVYLYAMPNSTAEERRKIEDEVKKIRSPSCND